MAKICSKCCLPKEDSEFYARGRVCRTCTRKKVAAWVAAHPDRVKNNKKAYAKTHAVEINRRNSAWRRRNPEKAPRYDWRRTLKQYGMDEAEFHRLLIEQSGRCAVCGDPLLKPCVDHDHETDEVRGLLCDFCNLLLGRAKDSVAVLLEAIRYLEKAAARRLRAVGN